MRKPSKWKHKAKYKTHKYQGSYERDRSGERVFVLRRLNKITGKIERGSRKHKMTFESHELAKEARWKKLS